MRRELHVASFLEVREIRHRADFDALAAEWDGLAGNCADHASAFVRHGFVAAWLDAFAVRDPWSVLWARDRYGGRAALAVIEQRTRIAGLPARVLASAADEHSCRLDIPHRPGDRAALAALWRHVCDRMRWDVLLLRDLVQGGATERALSRMAEEDGMRVGCWISNCSPYLDLAGGWEELQARLDGDFRRDLARRRRRLAEKGQVRLLRVTGGPALDRHLAAGLALEAAAWKGAAGTAIASAPETHQFYRRLAAHGARTGTLALLFLLVDETPIAFQFCLEQDRWLGVLKIGFDPAWRAFAPGRVLLAEAIEELVSRGGRELDFLGPDMPWKADWAPAYRQHVYWYAFRPGLGGAVRHAAKFVAVPFLRRRLRWLF